MIVNKYLVELRLALRGALSEPQIIEESSRVEAYLYDKWPRRLLVEKPAVGPAIVVCPKNRDEVQRVVQIAYAFSVPIVVRGGGSGVCGALARNDLPFRIIMSMEGLNQIRKIDDQNCLVEAEAGIMGNFLETGLNRRHLTLGHFPASLNISSLGGWLLTRSSGQASGRYGKIEQMVRRLEVILGNGQLIKLDNTLSVAGPDFLPAILGSEGTLGIVTAATLVVKPLPESRLFTHIVFQNWTEALKATEAIAHSGYEPAMVRLYDGFDARQTLLAGTNEISSLSWLKKKLLERDRIIMAIAQFAERWQKPHLIVVSEAVSFTNALDEQKNIIQLCIGFHGTLESDDVAEDWFKDRYRLSFEKVEALAKEGCFIDTVDLMVPWSLTKSAYDEIVKMVSPVALIFAHLSHLTMHGACMYLTFVGRKAEGRLEIYDKIWASIMDYCLAHGVGISDHHGIGLLKLAAFKQSRGLVWPGLYQSLKNYCDPHRILNPGHFDAE